jgi:hypothetical protein
MSQFYIDLHLMYRLFFSELDEAWIFSTDFRKYSNTSCMKISPAGAELFHEEGKIDRQIDRQMDRFHNQIPFRNFANAPKYEFLNAAVDFLLP